MPRVFLGAALALLIAPAASAGEQSSPLAIAQHIFEQADADKNGVLTPGEHVSAGLDRFGASFADFDLDRDSQVTWDEYRSIFERHHPAPGERSA